MAIDLLNIAPHKVSRDLSGYITYIYGPEKIGKAQPNDTIIPTPEGDKKLGDISVGDYVYDMDGNPTEVTGVFPQGKQELLKVTLNDGRVTFCAPEHLWTIITDSGKYKTVTTQEMIDSNKIAVSHPNGTGYNHFFRIPMLSAPVSKEEKHFSVDPYVMGAFLGDGCCKERLLTISSDDEEIVAEVCKRLNGESYYKNSEYNYSWNFTRKIPYVHMELGPNNSHREYTQTKFQTKEVFSEYLTEVVCSAQDKRIPSDYFEGSVSQRYELLQGLLDTDGCINNSGVITFTSTSLGLIEDIRKLIFSLGYRSGKVVSDNRQTKYKKGVCYSIRINCANCEKTKLFKLERKVNRAVKVQNNIQRRKYNRIEISSIEDMNTQVDMTCIYVNNPNHLYLTNDYIVTHNTTFCAKMEDCLILATERGYNALDGVYAVDITSWSDIRAVLRELKKPEVRARYKSIAVDTVDYAAEYCTKYICNQNGISDLSELGYGKGYSLMRKEFSDVFNTLIKLGYAVVFVSHSLEKTFTRPDGTEYNKIVPSLSPDKVNAIVANMADLYGYAHIIKGEDGENHRVLTLRAPDDSVACGCRFSGIQPNVPFTYDDVAKALHEAIDKMSNVTNEPIKPVKSNLPTLQEAKDGFNEVVSALRKNVSKEDFAKKWSKYIHKVVDAQLGAGNSVTEAGEDKIEQILTVTQIITDKVGEGI